MVSTAESSSPATAPQSAPTAGAAAAGTGKARLALIGTGGRSEMYIRAVYGEHAGTAELVAFSDVNPGRVEFYQKLIQELGAPGPVASFDPADLTAFIQANNIDRVVVTTPDYTHADYIVEALRAGADVVVEKPLTIDAEGCRRITAAVQETGRNVVVTFNYRYSPRNSALKEIIQSGVIGKVTSVDFSWVLDTVHGADYFRRWHREKKNSGGLLIHKASHHFDLVNWWINDVPERVFASGGLKFYGDKNAAERGLGPRPERGTPDADAPATTAKDPFTLDLRDDERLKALFLDNEHYDGYRRDQDVFTGGITIEDNLALVVEYQGGPRLSYSLNAHSPWEGYRVSVNGTEGRAELEVVERAAVRPARTKRRWWTRAQPPSRKTTPSAATASAWWSSATGKLPMRCRSSTAKADTAAVTPCCCPTCSTDPAKIRWAGRPATWMACVRYLLASPATAPWNPPCPSASKTSTSVSTFAAAPSSCPENLKEQP